MKQLDKFCYLPFHGFCIDPSGWLSYCCMDNHIEKIKDKPRIWNPIHIEDVEDLQTWWEKTYEPVWQIYMKNEQDSINPCFKCFSKDVIKGWESDTRN